MILVSVHRQRGAPLHLGASGTDCWDDIQDDGPVVACGFLAKINESETVPDGPMHRPIRHLALGGEGNGSPTGLPPPKAGQPPETGGCLHTFGYREPGIVPGLPGIRPTVVRTKVIRPST